MKSKYLLPLASSFLPAVSFAATKSWDYGAATANWADAANWNADGAPAAGDTVNFTTAGNTPPAITLNTSYQDSAAAINLGLAYGKNLTISSTATNELYVNSLSVTDAFAYTLDIAKNGSQGNSGTMPQAGATWSVAANATLSVKTTLGTKSGVSSGNVNKTGAGTLKLGDGTVNNVAQYLALNAQGGVTELGFTSGTAVNGISGISSGATVKITSANAGLTLLSSGSYSYQSGVTGVSGTFDLNGYNQTIASLGGSSAAGSVTNGGGGDSTLTIGINGLTGRNENNGSFAGVISDGATHKLSLTINPKNTVFVQTLTGANTYTGTTTISGGTLQVGGGGTTGTLGTGNIVNNAQLVFNRSDTYEYAGVISGTGSVTNAGSGTLTLNGANTYTGNTVVSGGSLHLGAGAQLKFTLGATSGTTNSISGAGSVTLDGSFVIDRTAALGLSAGFWTLENVPSLAGPYGPTFSVAGFTDSGGDTWTLLEDGKTWAFNEATGVLSVSTDVNHLAWNGSVDGNWDVDTTANWLNGATQSTYGTGDHAAFGDSATGTTAVVLNTTVSPLTITFDNTAKNYTLTGTGGIGGVGSLSKSGTGSVTIATDNTYAGNTTISAGTIHVGDGGTTGTLGAGAVANGGSLVFNRSNVLTLSSVVSGTGSIEQAGTGATILTADNTFSGATTITAGTLQVGSGGSTGTLGGTSSITNNGTLAFNRGGSLSVGIAIAGTGSLVQSGPGTLVLNNDMTYTGGTTINGGVVQLGNNTATGSVAGTIHNNAGLVISRSDDVNFTNTVTGSGSVTHAGSGTLRLTGTASDYYGGTVINGGGILLLDSSGSTLPTDTGISIANGVLDFSDLNLTVSSLAKPASGTGTIYADAGKTLTVYDGNVTANQGYLNLTGVDTFVMDGPARTFNAVSTISGGTATVAMAPTSSVTASTFAIGWNSPGGSDSVTGASVHLGATTTIHADTMIVGGNSAQSGISSLVLDTTSATPTVTIRGTSGGTSRSNLTVGHKKDSDYAGGGGVVDLTATGSVLDAMLGSLVIGKHETGTGNFNHTTYGSFSFNTGTLDATSITLAVGGAPSIKTADGTLTTNGGTIKVTTLTLVQDSGGPMGTATVNLNPSGDELTQPTLEATSITGQAAANAFVNVKSATLRNTPGADLAITGVTLNLSATADPFLTVETGRSATLGSGSVYHASYNPNNLDHPTLTVAGALVLGSPTLTLATSETPSALITPGTKLVLINYTAGSLSGGFAGLADGGTVSVDDQPFIIDYNDPAYSGKAVTLTAKATTSPFEDWLTLKGVTPGGPNTAPAEDYDTDGLENMVEYVLDTEPDSGLQSNLPVAATSGSNMTFTFTRLKAAVAAGFTTGVEYSETLTGTWSTATAGMFGSPVDNGATETITVTIPIPLGAAKMFARMKVVAP